MKKIMEANEAVHPNSELLNSLKKNFPQFFDAEGNFKADKFTEELQANNIQEARDGYRLSFVGKDYARLQTGRDSETMIMPDADHNSKPENADSQNVFITGDNLEALRHLQNAYLGKVKMIYIDPPYNTGKEFVYNDRFEFNDEKLQSALGYSNEEIARLKTIQGKSSHSAWLTFMYPRLKLAQKLLTNDGVIFVSIDDNEQANLKLLMDEVFGEGNFVECLKWKRKKQPSFLAKHTAKVMEYVLVYAKNSNDLEKLSIERISDATKKIINLTNQHSERVFPKGVVVKLGSEGVIPKGVYTIKTMTVEYLNDVEYKNGKTTNEVKVRALFSVSQEKINEYTKNGLLFITINKGLRRDVSEEEKERRKSITDLLIDWGDNQDSDNEMKDIFDGNYFDYTKPTKLISNLVKSVNNDDFTVLDFFAGSATTAHAVMQLNAEYGGNRKFIMVQLDEQTNPDSEAKKAGYNTIDEISRERIKRASAKIKSGNPLFEANLDLGFKHYLLTSPTEATLDKIIEFNPTENRLFSDDMVSALGGIATILATWLIDDGYDFSQSAQTIDFAGYTAHYIDNSMLYLISQGWGAEQTKVLLNKIGKHELNVNTIIVFGYSFTMESLRELEMNVKNTLNKQVLIEKRF